MTNFRAAFVLLAIVGLSPAQAQDLPPLVNGAAWKVKVPNGLEAKMTFNADGSGKVDLGLLNTNISWTVKDGSFCIDGLLGGAECMVLAASGDSVIGTSPKGEQFVFQPT